MISNRIKKIINTLRNVGAENHQIFFNRCLVDDERELIYTDGEVCILKQVSVGTTILKPYNIFEWMENFICLQMSKEDIERYCYYEILGLTYDEKTLLSKYLTEEHELKPDIYKLIPEYC